MKNYLVVGAGFAGAVYAYELAQAGHRVTVIDRRDHIAGNCYDFVNEHGILIHQYGPHIFHTSNADVVNWLGQFTEWTPYQHKVKAKISPTELYPLPINRVASSVFSKEEILSIFFRRYTLKMWGLPIEKLNPSILQRVPIRDDDNELYFPNDEFQFMPKLGYTEIFKRILAHPHIKVITQQTFDKSMETSYDFVFNSMAIDEYYDYQFGELPYRSIKFETITLPEKSIYSTATTNFTTESGPTRVTEWKNFPNTSEQARAALKTTLTYEYPCDYKENAMERYYPVQDIDGANKAIYQKYKEIENPKVQFIGRCGTYQYLDMHQVISSSLHGVRRFLAQQAA